MKCLCLCVLSLLLWLLPPAASAQPTALNRCVDAAGQAVYTDRSCDSVGARARLPAPPPAGNTRQRNTLGAQCPRRLSELVDALRSGIAGSDVNRLSSLYLWGAVSDAGAQRILGQLESIVRRPLVDIVPVYPRQPPDALQEPRMEAIEQDSTPPPAVRRHPVALRLEQTLPGSATRAASVLGLRRQHGCFWVTL